MSRRDYRVGESFRGTELGRNFKPHGLDKVGAEDLRAFHARMEQLRKEAKLQEHMIAPIGRILAADEAAKQAMETLREQTLAELNQQDLSKAPLPPKHGPPLSIRGTNCARSDTPYDAEWTS